MLRRFLAPNQVRWLVMLAVASMPGWSAWGFQSTDNRVVSPNFRQAEQYSSAYLRQFVYSTAVTPNWIGKSDEFWYAFRTSEGTRYWRVNPEKETRLPLFDHLKLAGQLSVLTRKPVEPVNLQLTRVELDDDKDLLKFIVDDTLFEYSLKTETLTKVGPAPRPSRPQGSPSRGEQRDEQQERRDDQQERRDDQQDQQRQDQQQQQQQVQQQQRDNRQFQLRDGLDGDTEISIQANTDRSGYRVFSPDRKHYVFAKGHNLYLVTIPPNPAENAPLPGDQPASGDNQAVQEQSQQTNQGDGKQEEQQKQQETKSDSSDQGHRHDQHRHDHQGDHNKETDQQENLGGQHDQQQQQQTDGQNQQEGQQQEQQGGQESQNKESTRTQTQQSNETSQTDQSTQKTEQTTQQTGDAKTGDSTAQQNSDAAAKPADTAAGSIPEIDPAWDDLAVQLSFDGQPDYSFAGRVIRPRGESQQTNQARAGTATGMSDIKDDTKTRPSAVWSEDSKSFHIVRRDSRGVKELWVINSLATPRPTLESYPYPMPGEENIRKSELYWFSFETNRLHMLKKKWKDESYSNIRYAKDLTRLQFLRRDRLLRNIELCSLDLVSGEVDCLFEEGFEQASISPQPPRYLKDSEEFIWWSERDGWGHFYLFGNDGKLKNQITSGPFVAARIVDVDETNRILYFYGNGREPGENLNYQHLYSIRLDGGDLKLLDPGDANHSSILSPSKKFLIDNYSRVDLAPESVLRRADGTEVMPLEKTDLSRLYQTGWKMPETFVVKAADGVTDLFGNMYKPFDFDPSRRYPIITYVYPGPQQEGTRHTFAATSGEQQLAQIGFIVIQVGHRGGTPRRSKAYASYGYFNLRDYALADKKTAIEQLAQRYPFIDVERVGIYGHSGGGFMTAAALMVPPYNEFFKAGFSTAGNHDNNIYNNVWSERWHGMKEVAVDSRQQRQNQVRPGESSETRGGSDPANSLTLQVDPEDFFYDFEVLNGEDPWEFDSRLREQDLGIPSAEYGPTQESQQLQQTQDQQQGDQQTRGDNGENRGNREGRRGRGRRGSNQNSQDQQGQQTEQNLQQQIEQKDQQGQQQGQSQGQNGQGNTQQTEQQTRFEIRVPTNAELAANLKHHLFLVHGELDNNVHPANTLRLVDALIKANKRFEMLYLPGTRHGFGNYQPYVTQRMFEFFAQRLLSDYQSGADMKYNR